MSSKQDSEIIRLGLAKDPATNRWLHGRRVIAEKVGASEWYVRRLLEEIRRDVGGTSALTPEEFKAAQELREDLGYPEVKIQIPKLKSRKPIERDTEIWVIGSDFQAPYQHNSSCEIFYQIIEELQPDRVYLLGDLINLDAFAKYDKPPSHNNWLDDVKEGGLILGNVRSVAPDSELIWVTGNHEDRLRRYFMRHDPLLYNILDLEKLFILVGQEEDVKGWIYLDKEELPFEDLNLILLHGYYVRKHSGMTAHAHIENLLLSVVHGHSHRLGIHYRSSGRSRYFNEQPIFGVECGCLCRLDVEYNRRRTTNWQHGFAILNIHRPKNGSPKVSPEVVEISNGKAHFRGKWYYSK